MLTESSLPAPWKFGRILAFGVSLGAHGVAYASLTARPLSAFADAPPSTIDFEVSAPPPPARELAKPPEPPPPAPVKVAPLSAVSRAIVPATPPAAPAPSTPAEPAAPPLRGVTLSDDSAEGPSVPQGDGSALQGPIGLGSSQVPHAAVAVVPALVVSDQPALVAVRDLREHPRPPALGDLLRANYPDEARQRGLRGTASVRARIDADGVVRLARLLNESAAEFGAACQRTVKGSHWSPPHDKNGRAVGTEIVYTCHFEVDQ